jgi:microcystin-dependent protein
MNQTDTTGENRFSGTTYFDNEILQTDATLITYVNKLIRTLFLKQIEAVSILRVNDTNYMFNDTGNDSALRVAAGDYPYVLSAGSQVLYTTPQRFSIAAQQTIAGSQISINQTTTTATNTANYAIANSIISTFTIPPQFSKRITLNIPISIRNAGTWSVGTSLSATITNTINSITARVYVNGILYATNPSVVIQNSNSSTRSTTIAYTSAGGSKTISLDQYFFNINIILTDFFASTYMTRDNNITNTLQILLSANITNTITRNSNTGNFTANNTLTFVSNTGVSTSTISTTGTPTITYSPNQNGTNYAAATSTPNYIDPINTLGGTTYTNHLRANSFNLLPVGMVIQYTGATAPTGWLLCNGTAYNASTNPIYQELFNVIGNQFGGTNNTDFKVPDYRGSFLRGTGTNGVTGYTVYEGQALNTPQAHATQTHTHTATQAVHTHTVRFKGNGNSAVQTGGGSVLFNPNATSFGSPDQIDIQTGQRINNGTQFENVQPAITVANSTTSVNADETRPFSYSVNYLIKF